MVLDGGGRVTLSGGGARRILYMNTCDDAQGHVSGSCIQQDRPRLTLQNLTFADANATGQPVATSGGIGGGGAVFAYGGRLTVVNSRFVRGRCDSTGPDLGGAAIRIIYQPHPATIVRSTFSGGACSNGGASSLHASWAVYDSVFSDNSAIGRGANLARAGTPGGGSGGAIYCDGDTYTLLVAGTVMTGNHADEGGGAIFFVSNDHTGTLTLQSSTLRDNVSARFETSPGIFYIGAGKPRVRPRSASWTSRAICVLLSRSSFSRMRETCALTVATPIPRSAAISALLWPCATASTTSRSRGVKRPGPPWPPHRRRPVRRRAPSACG